MDLEMLALTLLLFVVVGSICGIAALLHLRRIENRLQLVELRSRSWSTADRKPGAAAKSLDGEEDRSDESAGLEESSRPGERDVATIKDDDFVEPLPDDLAGALGLAPALESVRPAGPHVAQGRVRSSKGPTLDLESLIGRRFMAAAGAFVLLCGIAFFLKYAYDNGWVGPSGRLALGALCGAACLVVGTVERVRRLGGWADLVSGLGFAIWYLCIWFAFEVWGLWGAPFAFGVAALVTAAAMFMAARRDSIGLMGLALLAGHLSPVLLSTGENRPFILFGWIAVLAAAGLGMASWRGWGRLALPIALGGALLFLGWQLEHYDLDQRPIAVGFLLLMQALHGLLPYIRAIRGSKEPAPALLLSSIVACGGAVFTLAWLFPGEERMAGLFILASTAIHFTPALLLGSRGVPGRIILGQGFVVLTAGTAAVFGLPPAPVLAAATASLAARLVRSHQLASTLGPLSALAAILALVAAALGHPGLSDSARPFLDPGFLVWTPTAALIFLGCAFALPAARSEGDAREPWSAILAFFGLISLGLGWHLEIARWWALRGQGPGGPEILHQDLCFEVLTWSLIAIGAAIVARALRWRPMRGLALLPLVVAGGLVAARLDDIIDQPGAPALMFVNLRTLAGLFFSGALVATGWAFAPARARAGGGARSLWWGLGLLGLLSAALVLHLDLDLYWESRGGDDLARMRSWLLLWTVLPLLFALARLLRPALPEPALRLFQVTGILVLLLSAAGPASIGAAPLLNLDLGLRVALFAAVLLGNRVLERSGRASLSTWICLALQAPLAIALAWDLHHWSVASNASLPFLGAVDERLGTGLISAIWSIQAFTLTLIGFRRSSKPLRVMGLVFFGVVLAKVLLVDTSSLRRVHRILSFMASGFLMLLGSWIYQRVASEAADEDEAATP